MFLGKVFANEKADQVLFLKTVPTLPVSVLCRAHHFGLVDCQSLNVHSRQNATRNEGKQNSTTMEQVTWFSKILCGNKIHTLYHLVYFWGQFCDVTKVAISRRKDLAKLGHNKEDMKIIFKKKSFYIFLQPARSKYTILVIFWFFFNFEFWLLRTIQIDLFLLLNFKFSFQGNIASTK